MTTIALAMMAGLTMSQPAPAAEPFVVSASAPAIPGLDGPVQEVVDRALRQYLTAQSYEDTVVCSTELEFDGPLPLEAPEPTERSLALVRPGRLLLKTPLYQIACDGQTLWELVDPWFEYVERPAPKAIRASDLSLTAFQFFTDNRHPLLTLLIGGDAMSLSFLGHVTQAVEVKAESRDGAAGKRVRAMVWRGSSRTEVPVDVWFDDNTGLIGEIVYDHTGLAQATSAGAPGVKIRKYVQRYRFKDICYNERLPDDMFAFKPPEHFRKTARLRMPSSQEVQQRLIGTPAVDFVGKDLDGKEVKLADFKGRVLLLDFWSTRCGPCVMSIPTLQRVADKYADKAVSMVGVNLDGPEATDNVAALFKSRGGKFRQIIQTRPSLASKYFVEGIPCMVIVDPRGTIQAVHLGMAMEAELSRKIDTLLKGENLYTRR